jgi:hypothetical protein
VLRAITAAPPIRLASNPTGSATRPDGFLAYGRVSVPIFSRDAYTPRTKRCIASSVQAGIDVRQGTPVVISLDGNAVGGGDLSTGQLSYANPRRGTSGSFSASCQYTFSAPVIKTGDGRYTVDIGDARIDFSMDDLRDGIDLRLS